jgi:hypothetical protein
MEIRDKLPVAREVKMEILAKVRGPSARLPATAGLGPSAAENGNHGR